MWRTHHAQRGVPPQLRCAYLQACVKLTPSARTGRHHNTLLSNRKRLCVCSHTVAWRAIQRGLHTCMCQARRYSAQVDAPAAAQSLDAAAMRESRRYKSDLPPFDSRETRMWELQPGLWCFQSDFPLLGSNIHMNMFVVRLAQGTDLWVNTSAFAGL